MAGGDHNVKHPELLAWYRSYNEEKCRYSVFICCVVRYWYTREEAITPKSLIGKRKIKTEIRENGRVCTVCGVFKFQSWFSPYGRRDITIIGNIYENPELIEQ